MKNKIKKLGIGIGAALILIGGRVSFSEPGTQSDPLVTFSYVERRIKELKEYIDTKINPSDLEGEDQDQSAWKVVEIEQGQSLIAKAGTELILRSGVCTTISNISKTSKNGVETIIDNGLTDVTDGKDLKMGEDVPRDHLLIIPRDDGRGVNCIAKAFFLVKGDYTIK